MEKITGGNTLLDPKFLLDKIQIQERQRVADLGCGASGHFVFPTARMVGKSGKVYAVDIMKKILETINKRVKQENIENVETVWSDLEIFKATKIEASSLDVAMLINTLYLSNKRAEIIREAVRLLKKGGKLLIVEWKSTAIPFGPPREERVLAENIIKASKKLGLEAEEEFFAGHYHYGLIFNKI